MNETYFTEKEVRDAVEKLIIRINSGLFLQGVKSRLNVKTTADNVIKEMKGEI